MKILVTNDDGYKAKGIKLLEEKLKKYGELYIVAPDKHMSGASVSRAFWEKMRVYQHEDNVYSVDGTPADAVALALHGLNIRPDVVISGINNGFNVGADTVYSGTVGAAMEALKAHIPAIAFSADWDHFEQAEKDFDKVMDFIIKKQLISDRYMLNVNFPSRDFKKSKGIMITDLGFRPTEHYFISDGEFYITKRSFVEFKFVEETDLYAINNGYISITPLKFANSTQQGLKELRKKVSRGE